MRWARFEAGHDGPCWGVVSGDLIEAMKGSPFGNWSRGETRHNLDAVKLLAPIEKGSLFAPAQPNYGSHFQKHAHVYGQTPAARLDFNYRGLNSVVSCGEPIVIPADATDDVVFEGELAVIIGKRASAIDPAEAKSVILGYTIANDVTDRGWQGADRTVWRAKNSDTFCPIGPWIETEFDPAQAQTAIRLNGKPVAGFATGDMIFDVPNMLARLTRYVTLQPGDMILCGTDEPTLRIAPGDTVEVDITGIGSLSNPVVAEISRNPLQIRLKPENRNQFARYLAFTVPSKSKAAQCP